MTIKLNIKNKRSNTNHTQQLNYLYQIDTYLLIW